MPRETYLKGYQVFRRVEGQQDFEQISTTLLHPRQNRFSDSTFLTNARYEYVIKAYDDFGAESAFSITSSIQLENYVQLFSEHISARRTPEGILVKWTPSAQPRLLKEWRIYRAKNGENYQLQATLEGSLLDYSDLAVQKDAFYSYIVIAVDHSGMEHPAEQPVSLKY